MNQLVEVFLLGNASILTNVCLLPLYPGLVAFLAGNVNNEKFKGATGWLGLLVLAGVLTLMTLVSLLIYFLETSFATVLPWLLPIIYGTVIVLGILMLIGFNPFYKFSTLKAPILKNPYLTAYFYGLLLGPMTLPCTGPFIFSAFVLSAGSTTSLANELLYFLVFGIGFGWPLVLLPLIAMPLQRTFISWLTKNYKLITRLAGLLLLGIACYGLWVEVIPQL